MKRLLVVLFACTSALCQAPATKTAVSLVADLKAKMLDPASFVLEGAYTYQTKKLPQGFFFVFRSHNAMGGYAPGCAYAGEVKGKMALTIPDGEYASDICASNMKAVHKNPTTADITSDVQKDTDKPTPKP